MDDPTKEPIPDRGGADIPGRAIISAMSAVVPFSRRAEWVAEWTGELAHRWHDVEQRGARTHATRIALTFRALGCIPDACFLRRRLTETPMLANDIRYALRTLLRRPGFTTVVVLTLALGIGSTTAIFSVVNAVLLRSLPFDDPQRLVALRGTPTDGDVSKVSSSSSWPDFVDYRASARAYDELAAFSESVVTLTGATLEPVPVPGAAVTPNLFRALGVTPTFGGAFSDSDAGAGQPRVVVISHHLWRTRLGADSGAVGRSLTIDGVPHAILGVMPEEFEFPAAARLWVPLIPSGAALERGMHNLAVVGRLAAGTTRDAAAVEARRIFRALEIAHPESNAKRTASVEPLGESAVRGIRPVLLVLLGAVGTVLLIVCTNVASLFLARAASREREVAVRIALGAGRGRIARQFLVESVLLSVTGGLLGLAIALWGVDLLVAAAPSSIPRANEISVDLRVLGFVLGVSLLTGIAFGAIPAIQLGRLDANGPLKDGSHTVTATRVRRRVRQMLVVAEVSLAMVLVIGAGLLIATVARLQHVDPGFDPQRMLVTHLQLPPARYATPGQVLAYYEAVRARVEAIPGVRAAAVAFEHPLSPGWTSSFTIAGREPPARGHEPEARVRPITPGYLRTAGAQLLRGRDITAADRAGAPGVVIINDAFARQHFPGENPLGRRLDRGPWWPEMPGSFEIIGVIRDERFLGLAVAADAATYFPHAQFPLGEMYLLVRAAGDPAALIPSLRNAVWSVDRDIPVEDVRTMDDLLGGTLARPRFVGTLLGLFAGAALLLSALGIYGVLSYTVAQRTPEIGIRMALGAQRGAVMRTVVGQGMALALAGIAIGAVAAVAATRALSGLLFGVTPTDPLIFGAVALLLAATALVAAYVPARRASRVDPLIALRQG